MKTCHSRSRANTAWGSHKCCLKPGHKGDHSCGLKTDGTMTKQLKRPRTCGHTWQNRMGK